MRAGPHRGDTNADGQAVGIMSSRTVCSRRCGHEPPQLPPARVGIPDCCRALPGHPAFRCGSPDPTKTADAAWLRRCNGSARNGIDRMRSHGQASPFRAPAPLGNRSPRVAATRQPWAMKENLFEVVPIQVGSALRRRSWISGWIEILLLGASR
jgi:hypothetical protein